MANEEGYELDFLPVGVGERSGDAIAVRWREGGSLKTMIYDGGTQASGTALVEHFKKYYETNRVDYVVNSHPDADHASGLSVVLTELEVGEVWIHQPWKHSSLISNYFHDGRITDNSLAERLKTKMSCAYMVCQLAERNDIPVHEPYQGCRIGPFTVLSPEKQWYIHDLIQAFEKSPEQKKQASEKFPLFKAISDSVKKVLERWDVETLREDVETSAENESSVILYGTFAGKGVLLTGDAGVTALSRAVAYAQAIGVNLPTALRFVQVPHHGSRNNVSPSVLDALLGPKKRAQDQVYSKTGFVSAGANSATHPRPAVVNAFLRRGASVIPTKGTTKRHHFNMPARDWGAVESMKFSNEVDPW